MVGSARTPALPLAQPLRILVVGSARTLVVVGSARTLGPSLWLETPGHKFGPSSVRRRYVVRRRPAPSVTSSRAGRTPCFASLSASRAFATVSLNTPAHCARSSRLGDASNGGSASYVSSAIKSSSNRSDGFVHFRGRPRTHATAGRDPSTSSSRPITHPRGETGHSTGVQDGAPDGDNGASGTAYCRRPGVRYARTCPRLTVERLAPVGRSSMSPITAGARLEVGRPHDRSA